MSPEPTTNDYLADILAELREIKDLLQQAETDREDPKRYVVREYGTLSPLTQPNTKEIALDCLERFQVTDPANLFYVTHAD